MKNFFFGLFSLLAPTMLFSQTSVTRSLPSFDKIGVSGGFDGVFVKEGGSESVTIDVKGIDPAQILTDVKDNTLTIKMKNGSWSNFKAKITVTYRSLRAIANSGSTDIEALTVIKADKFELASSGSGDFKGEFDVRDLDVSIAGSSDMTLKGKAENQDIAISGSGDIHASGLAGHTAEVAISGSGDVELAVKGKVKTAVSGSGTVTNN